ncbi:MAG: hypothetical protein O2867_03355 [Bacteroidetes bacterium]|nr:hypothetical protein [Bacteroidota bacterium]
MRTKNLIAILVLTAFTVTALNAREYKPKGTQAPKPKATAKMIDCNPPIAYTEFALNNIRFGLETGGQLWENNGNASYEIPKVDPSTNLPSVHSIYAGGLWMGGRSPDGQLRVAAVTYRTGGTDFYNGPLSNNTFATADLCDEFDRHFFANRTDALIHRSYFLASEEERAELFPNGYVIPAYFFDWPGNNDLPNYAPALAPYFDFDGDGRYDPELGDFPGYDLDNAIDCKTRNRTDPIPLFGDQTLWWVFNDNGGVHTEFGGERIGMEIQAQCFAYTTTDQINNMSFYNYVLINRGTQTLNDTYFGQWCDSDLGCSTDDYVGCDVERGLGYCYNGDDNDVSCGASGLGYGLEPPAVGIDFFEGPYQDSDGIDNPLTEDLSVVQSQLGIPYQGIGIGYGDDVIDNERFGMRRFVYYNIGGDPTNGDVNTAADVYNYLNGIWKDGTAMTFGGNGVGQSLVTNYMFPGLTDPLGFATNGTTGNIEWDEETEENPPGDRRFVQSAGTFVLDPGEFNNITVGVVWARPFGNSILTLNALKSADDKAQSLFDNCFRLLSGPDAPDLTFQEMDKSILLYLENENPTSNNFRESYGFPSDFAFDPLIPGITEDGTIVPLQDKYYEFQGYKIYQLKNATVSASEIGNPDLARLQFQVDIQDGIAQLINWVDDPQLGIKVPIEAVDGADEGISHSFRVTQDLFAVNDRDLVNFKKYYFLAVAYAYNNYAPYNPASLDGQPLPYIESRKSALGDISVITAIPHKPEYESQGTVINSNYGDILPVTRIEGEGNGGNILELSDESKMNILNSPYNITNELKYNLGSSPIEVEVVDPLNVRKGNFKLGLIAINGRDLIDDIIDGDWEIGESQNVGWYLVNVDEPNDTIFSANGINVGGEDLVLDYGISVTVDQQVYNQVSSNNTVPEFLGGELVFENPSIPWLIGVPDVDGVPSELDWIRSGTNTENADPDCDPDQPFSTNPQTGQTETSPCYYLDNANADPNQAFEGILNGWMAPWTTVSHSWNGPCSDASLNSLQITKTSDVNNVDIRLTPEKQFWTRVPVLENQVFPIQAQGRAEKNFTRVALSVDKNGKNQQNGGNYDECTMFGTQLMTQDRLDDLSTAEKTQYKLAVWPTEDPGTHTDSELLDYSFGMGWFPGYTIDIETGERLNMAFSENSWLASENGRDMMWNPTSSFYNGVTATTQTDFDFGQIGFLTDPNNARLGGLHYIYVFRNQSREATNMDRMPSYDNAQFLFSNINISGSIQPRQRIFRSCTWVFFPLLNPAFSLLSPEQGLIPSAVDIRVRVAKPYAMLATVADIYEDYLWLDESDEWSTKFPYFNWDNDSGVSDSTDFEIDEFIRNPGTAEADTLAMVGAMTQSENNWMPLYSFSTDGFEVQTGVTSVIESALDLTLTNVVPNPYYAFAPIYENTRFDNRVKVINLPERCTVRIYNTAGVLVRTLEKDNPLTFLEWDLKNERSVPIAGGVHIFHIEVPGVGEKVVKWFGAMRPIDLDNF